MRILNIANPIKPVMVGQYNMHGWINGLTLANNYAYLAAGYEREIDLWILDVSDPTQPVEVAIYDVPDGTASPTIIDSYAYLPVGTGDLQILDISDPSTPVKMNVIPQLVSVMDVSLADNYAYIGTGSGGLGIIDISTPTTPRLTSQYTPLEQQWRTTTLTLIDHYAYLTCADNAYPLPCQDGPRIIDIDNPAQPQEIALYRSPEDNFGRWRTANNIAYAPAGQYGLRLIKLSNPHRPVEIGSYYFPRQVDGMLIQQTEPISNYTLFIHKNDDFFNLLTLNHNGQQVYMQSGEYLSLGGTLENSDSLLPVTDITGNNVPDIIIGDTISSSRCYGVYHILELGQTPHLLDAFTADYGCARFKDLDSDNYPEIIASDGIFGCWNTSCVGTPDVWVTMSYQNGAYRPSIELMRQPGPDWGQLETTAKEIKNSDFWYKYGLPSNLWGKMLDLIYSGHADLAWRFFNIAWPPDVPGKNGFLLSFLSRLTHSPYWPEIQAMNAGQWPVQSATANRPVNPPLPLPKTTYPAITVDDTPFSRLTWGPTRAVFIQNSYAYVGVGPTLILLDITQQQPAKMGYITLPGIIEDIYVSGHYAYIAESPTWFDDGPKVGGGLRIVDVSNPALPVEAGFYEIPNIAHKVVVAQQYTYLITNNVLYVLDISNPATPVDVGTFYIPGENGQAIAVNDHTIYLAAGYAGLFILQFTPPY